MEISLELLRPACLNKFLYVCMCMNRPSLKARQSCDNYLSYCTSELPLAVSRSEITNCFKKVINNYCMVKNDM